jgi:hypothetical protein
MASTATARCNAGETATGGGYFLIGTPTVVQSTALVTNGNNIGWIAAVFNPGPNNIIVRAVAECASLGP